MKKYLIFLLIAFLFVPLLKAEPPDDDDKYYNGFIPLFADDTLTTDASATDSVVAYTTEHEALGDTLYWSFWLLAKETGAQTGNLDIDLTFSPDSSSGFCAYYALKANLDVGATCDNTWYRLPTVATNAVAIYTMKWMKIVINNVDADANEVIIEKFGIAFKKKD